MVVAFILQTLPSNFNPENIYQFYATNIKKTIWLVVADDISEQK